MQGKRPMPVQITAMRRSGSNSVGEDVLSRRVMGVGSDPISRSFARLPQTGPDPAPREAQT